MIARTEGYFPPELTSGKFLQKVMSLVMVWYVIIAFALQLNHTGCVRGIYW